MRMQFYAIEIARSVPPGSFLLPEADLGQKPRRPERLDIRASAS